MEKPFGWWKCLDRYLTAYSWTEGIEWRHLRWWLDLLMIFSRNVLWGAKSPLHPPDIMRQCYSTALLLLCTRCPISFHHITGFVLSCLTVLCGQHSISKHSSLLTLQMIPENCILKLFIEIIVFHDKEKCIYFLLHNLPYFSLKHIVYFPLNFSAQTKIN